MLLVTDTCLEGRPGYWYAMKATSDGHSTKGDMFPLNQRKEGRSGIEHCPGVLGKSHSH